MPGVVEVVACHILSKIESCRTRSPAPDHLTLSVSCRLVSALASGKPFRPFEGILDPIRAL